MENTRNKELLFRTDFWRRTWYRVLVHKTFGNVNKHQNHHATRHLNPTWLYCSHQTTISFNLKGSDSKYGQWTLVQTKTVKSIRSSCYKCKCPRLSIIVYLQQIYFIVVQNQLIRLRCISCFSSAPLLRRIYT